LLSLADKLRLVTFDADGTIYEDGANLTAQDSVILPLLKLLEHGFYVAIITAAGYPNQPQKYEERFAALLGEFAKRRYDDDTLSRFFIIGGETNYLFKVDATTYRLRDHGSNSWQLLSYRKVLENGAKISAFLDKGQQCLERCRRELNVEEKLKVIRKERALGR
jgi:IMP and pyridine-specific 5'-nucleotidase